MTHDVTVSAAECAECKHRTGFQYGMIVVPEDSDKDKAAILLAAQSIAAVEHLQAQKDAAYAMLTSTFGEQPLAAILERSRGQFIETQVLFMGNALRAQMEAKR